MPKVLLAVAASIPTCSHCPSGLAIAQNMRPARRGPLSGSGAPPAVADYREPASGVESKRLEDTVAYLDS